MLATSLSELCVVLIGSSKMNEMQQEVMDHGNSSEIHTLYTYFS